MKRVNFFLSPEVLDRLKRLAANLGGGYAEHIRAAVNEYLKKHKH